MIPIEAVVGLSAILFGVGLYGVLARRNAVLILLAVEVMLNAVSLNFVAFGAFHAPGELTGQIFAIFVICIAAAEVGLALGILLRLYRNRRTVDVDEVNELKW
ncbi:MAG: NADH-quinone oxidoreductase subunit NuoK [Dehalococcoidia bacterium]